MTGHLILIGMMGAGKTTVGSRIARALERRFVDSDVEVEARSGRTVRQIFEAEGEPAFRALESEVLAEALAQEEPLVIAAAGGTVLDATNRTRMRQCGTVVFLQAAPTALVDRVGGNDHRPLLADDPDRVLREIEGQRRPFYEETAHHVVDASQPIDEVVRSILELA